MILIYLTVWFSCNHVFVFAITNITNNYNIIITFQVKLVFK